MRKLSKILALPAFSALIFSFAFIVQAQTPPAPVLQDPAAVPDSACGVRLNWTYSGDTQNITFDLNRNNVVITGVANAPASSYVNAHRNPAGMIVNPGTLYSYQIRSRNTQTGESSDYSLPPKSITTPSLRNLFGFSKPGSPASLSGQAKSSGNIYADWATSSPSSALFPTYGKFKVTWANSNDGAIYGADISVDNIPLQPVSGSSPIKYFYEFTAPDKNLGYQLKVYSKEVGGLYCDPTNLNHYLLSDPSTEIIIPPRPSGFAGIYSSSPREVNLSWTNRATNANYLLISRSTSLSGGNLANPISFPNQPANSTSYKDTSIDPAVSRIYYYAIKTCRTGGSCSFVSEPLQVLVGVVVPQNFKAAVAGIGGGKVSISLSWTGDPIFGQTYTIQRSTDGDNFSDITGAAPAVNNLSADAFADLGGYFLDKNRDVGGDYYYRIKVTKNTETDHTEVARVKTNVTPVKGWAWSGHGLGWIRLSNDSVKSAWGGASGAPPETNTPYGVFVDSEGAFSGYAWSPYAGWLSFNEDSDCPGGSNCRARLEGAGAVRRVVGWAAFLQKSAGGQTFKHWVSLSKKGGALEPQCGSNCDYGLHYGESTEGNITIGQLRGFAWGGDVVGWVTFGGPVLKNVKNLTTGQVEVSWENWLNYPGGVWIYFKDEESGREEIKARFEGGRPEANKCGSQSQASCAAPTLQKAAVDGLSAQKIYNVWVRGYFK